jgi:hypothetical protein
MRLIFCFAVSALLLVSFLACKDQASGKVDPREGQRSGDSGAANEIPFSRRYESVNRTIKTAHFGKPDPRSPLAEGTEAFALAPLLVLETPSGTDAEPEFGEPDAHGTVAASSPRVFVSSTTEIVGKQEARQFLYEWWVRWDQNRAFLWQGVRITLDDQGMPRVWEQLWEPAGMRVLYVSQAWEKRATQEFGGKLPGRAYSIEPSLEHAPRSVVARILADGPVPMGPWVYQQPNGDVMTLICRCMASQVQSLHESRLYTLLPQMIAGAQVERPDQARPEALSSLLRLPR